MKLVLLLCAMLLSACAAPDGMRALKSSDKIVYQLPSEHIDLQSLYWGVDFGLRKYDLVRGGFRYRTTAQVLPKNERQCEVTFSTVIKPVTKKDSGRTLTSSRSYIFEVDRTEKNKVSTVEFKPHFEVGQPNPDFNGAQVSPPDTLANAMEILATSGTLTFKFEMESKRSPAAIVGEFRKYCREQSHRKHPVQIMNRTFETSYVLASGGTTIATFFLTLSPTSAGTKASVIARVKLAPDANYQVDAVAQSADMRHVVADIINP